MRVLIAEDETLIRLDLASALGAAGFVVCAEATDGEQAVALALEQAPDVVVMDANLPRLDGISAARRILAEQPTPIVMLTAYNYGELIDRALDAGIKRFVVKPFAEAELVDALRAVLDD